MNKQAALDASEEFRQAVIASVNSIPVDIDIKSTIVVRFQSFYLSVLLELIAIPATPPPPPPPPNPPTPPAQTIVTAPAATPLAIAYGGVNVLANADVSWIDRAGLATVVGAANKLFVSGGSVYAYNRGNNQYYVAPGNVAGGWVELPKADYDAAMINAAVVIETALVGQQ